MRRCGYSPHWPARFLALLHQYWLIRASATFRSAWANPALADVLVSLAGGVAFVHVFLPRIFGLRLDQVACFATFCARAEVSAACASLRLFLLRGVVDVGDLLPHFDNVAHLNIQLLDLTRSLRSR